MTCLAMLRVDLKAGSDVFLSDGCFYYSCLVRLSTTTISFVFLVNLGKASPVLDHAPLPLRLIFICSFNMPGGRGAALLPCHAEGANRMSF